MKFAKAAALVVGALAVAAIAVVLVISHLHSKQQDDALDAMERIEAMSARSLDASERAASVQAGLTRPGSSPAPLPYERMTDTVLVADLVVVGGESWNEAGRRLTQLGKELCLIPGAETAILNVVSAENHERLGQVTLPLSSFLDFHVGDSTDQMMAARMWETNSVVMLQQALGGQ